jgi:hypothetical protein
MMLEYFNPIRILILLTFVIFLFLYDQRKKDHQLLLIILSVAVINEGLTIVFRINNIPHQLNNTIYTVVTQILWLAVLGKLSGKVTLSRVLALFVALFSVINLLLIQGFGQYNGFTFVFGAFLYVGLFALDCYARLKNEDLAYFASSQYILATAPLLFFIGFSILFGFQNKSLHNTDFFGYTLFKIVCYFINIVYYLLINFYLFKDNKKVYA